MAIQDSECIYFRDKFWLTQIFAQEGNTRV